MPLKFIRQAKSSEEFREGMRGSVSANRRQLCLLNLHAYHDRVYLSVAWRKDVIIRESNSNPQSACSML